MSKKWSSNDKMQRLHESFRSFLKEDDKALLSERETVPMDTGMDLNTWMNKELEDLPTPPISALDAQALDDIDHGASEYDGDPDDDKIQNSDEATQIEFSSLYASQNEIGTLQSLRNTMGGDPDQSGLKYDGIDWGDPNTLLKAMSTPSYLFNFNSPIVAANVKEGHVILDGHHRWSQAFMVNPNGKINAVGFSAPNLTADDMLQALHLGVYAVADQAGVKAAKGGNLLADAVDGEIDKYFNQAARKVNPESFQLDPENGVSPYVAAFMKWKGISDPQQGHTAAKAYALEAVNLMKGRVVTGAPKRTKMPQTDVEVNPGATPQAVGAALASGEVNHETPYRKQGGQ